MLWVYGQYKYIYSYRVGIDFSHQSHVNRSQILTAKLNSREHGLRKFSLSNYFLDFHPGLTAGDYHQCALLNSKDSAKKLEEKYEVILKERNVGFTLYTLHLH